MEEVKYIHDIRNGDLVVTRDKERYIKIDKYLIGKERYLYILDYQIETSSILDKDEFEQFDIIEIWAPMNVFEFLSFDFEFRELIWKEEQKYNIKHKWLGNEGYDYINLVEGDSLLALGLSVETKSFKTKFTEKEIEEIKKMCDTDLKDFEIIPVKEI